MIFKLSAFDGNIDFQQRNFGEFLIEIRYNPDRHNSPECGGREGAL